MILHGAIPLKVDTGRDTVCSWQYVLEVPIIVGQKDDIGEF